SVVWWMMGRWEEESFTMIEEPAPMPSPSPMMPLPTATISAANSNAINVNPSSLPPKNAVTAGKERQEASLRIAAALGHELRGPLASILGFGQMILSSSKETSVTEPTELILRETRSVRDVLDKLLAFAGEKTEEKKPAKIETTLAQVLKDFEAKFNQRFIRL